MFANREAAGKLLGERLKQVLSQPPYSGADNIVIGLPRGGVPVAAQVSLSIGAPLSVLVAKKIGAPGEPEYAVGAVCSSGEVALNPFITITPSLRNYIDDERQRLQQVGALKERKLLADSGLLPAELQDKQVIIVDDGIATGMTALAAIEAVKRRGARRVILAVSVAEPSTCHRLSQRCDLVVALMLPAWFESVGQFYENFAQVSDEQVVMALREGARCLR